MKALQHICLFLLLFTGGTLAAAQPKFSELPASAAAHASNPRPTAVSGTNSPLAPAVEKPGFTNSMDTLDDKYRLAIGDKLSYRIVEDEEDPKPLIVTDSGELELPLLGRYPAVGKTCKELARELNKELCKEYYYQATVIIAVDVMTKSRGKVYVLGPVRAPGPQDIPSDETLTLSKAILRAGGFGDFADRHAVRLTRKGGSGPNGDQIITIDVSQILEKGKTELDIPLEPGDFIYVPERAIRF